jgi:hypothetical protein
VAGPGCTNGCGTLPRRVSLTPSGEVSVTAPTPAFLSAKATLKAELRRDASFVAQLRDYLDGRLSELTDEANRIVGGIVDDARERWPGGEWKGLVVLVDSLDHNRSVDSDLSISLDNVGRAREAAGDETAAAALRERAAALDAQLEALDTTGEAAGGTSK